MKLLAAALLSVAVYADTKIKLEDLPPVVRAAVQEQTRNAALMGLSKEVEKGKTMYEVETKVNGRARDLLLDASGKVVSVEEEVDINSIPAAAKSAIEKKTVGGRIRRVETVTQGSKVTYEAQYEKGGKTHEVAVNADGSVHK